MEQYEQICIITIIVSCSILLFIPKMLYRPGLILTFLFFYCNGKFCIVWNMGV